MPPCRYIRDRSDDRPRILANRYEVIKKLGTGTFGTVFLVKDLMCEGELKVSKEISLGDLKPDETVDAIREANLLSRLDHPNIVKFFDSFVDGEFFCIITEYCEGGDLADKIAEYKKKGKSLEESDILSWFVQLVLSVQYIHSLRVLHRDIKTRNIFLKNNVVKLGDFGISRILMGTTDLASTFVGTPYFMSPEVLKHEGYNSTSDVWSVGCILYELCTHEHAFSGQSLMSVMYKITEGKIPDLPSSYSQQLNKIYKRMLQQDPKDRPSASQITKLPFIAEHINEMLSSLTDYTAKQNWEENSRNEAEDLAELLGCKSRLSDLMITDSETRRLASLTPSQMLQVTKKMKADDEARKISAYTLEQRKETHQRNKANRNINELTHVPAWRGEQGDGRNGRKLYNTHTVKNTPVNKEENTNEKTPLNNNLRTSAPKFSLNSHLPVPAMSRSVVPACDPDRFPQYPTYTIHPRRALISDDRPITPMKNTMVYDVKNSSLDFRDGIPDEAELADTYYSQFDDFEAQADGEDSPDDDIDDMTLTPAVDDLDKDVENLMQCLEGALSTSENDATLMISDDHKGGAFNPSVTNGRIKKLTDECEKILGKEKFMLAYNYLKEARYSKSVGSMDESDVFKGLRKYVANAGDCFLIDQLLFLEEQAKLSNNMR